MARYRSHEEETRTKSLRGPSSLIEDMETFASLQGTTFNSVVFDALAAYRETPEVQAALKTMRRARTSYQKTIDKLSGEEEDTT